MWIFFAILLYIISCRVIAIFAEIQQTSSFYEVTNNLRQKSISTLSTLSTFLCGNLLQENTLFSFQKSCAIILVFQIYRSLRGIRNVCSRRYFRLESERSIMSMITLHNTSHPEVTILSNTFIDNYMPEANGEFVKFISIFYVPFPVLRFHSVWSRWLTGFSVQSATFSAH